MMRTLLLALAALPGGAFSPRGAPPRRGYGVLASADVGASEANAPSAVADRIADARASAEKEALWRAHSKPLLRIGANGVQDSHRRSLEELLEAHSYVCVKITAFDESSTLVVALKLAGSVADVVQVKGRSVLFTAKKAINDQADESSK
ncbi:hypothetical protein M885DRAFT_515860 [Pelagophyceae sp. CCMP2097]|nr:hypothetical protein M885DRAFT_515860 [Pelagophyceae sp. CCMP2097]